MTTQRPAQTLLELVIAVGVISTSTIAAITLIVRTITISQQSQTSTEAMNYAREGVEVIRAIRDSNWLKRDQNVTGGDLLAFKWDDDNVPDAAYTSLGTAAGRHWVLSKTDPGLSLELDDCGASACDAATQRIVIVTKSVNGISSSYATQNSAAEGVNTKYSRDIQVRKVADTVDIGGTNYATEYLDVISTVTWTSGAGAQTIVARERLYDWK